MGPPAKFVLAVATSSVSFVASSTIATMILVSPKKLTTPYRRLIFGLSVSDIVQSLALLTGPFASPKGSILAPWAIGNIMTCNLNGFMSTNAFSFVPMYTASLSVYYACKLTKGMSDETFARRIEPFLHIGPIIYNLVLTSTALALKSYNLSRAGFCYYAPYPLTCDIPGDPSYGQCTRGDYYKLFILIGGVGGPVICLCTIVYCAILLTKHAMKKTAEFNAIAGSQVNARDPGRQTFESQGAYISRLYMTETITQALLYVACFFFVYIMPLVAIIFTLTSTAVEHEIIVILFTIFFPLGGLFNICVYCRPKLNALRRREDISWIAAFLRVIRAGGEIPEGDSPLCGCLFSATSPVLKQEKSDDEFLSYEPESNVVLNGQSESFDEDHVAHRKSSNWSYVSGVENETREHLSVYTPEDETIHDIMYARGVTMTSNNVSGLSIDEEV